MSTLHAFSTLIYKKKLHAQHKYLSKLNLQLLREIEDLSVMDRAGISWSKKNYGKGFTSYASANRMHETSPTFAELDMLIRKHVAKFVSQLSFNINAKELEMSTCWVNIMPKGALHSMHHHPLSAISGTYYVVTPDDCSCIEFEDPRYGLFMARPPLKPKVPLLHKTHVSVAAQAGNLVLFESWLRHQVPINTTPKPRMSISFNYDWR